MTIKQWADRYGTVPAKDTLVLQRDDPATESEGGIILAKEAQRTPVSGVVVLAPEILADAYLGRRVYFRPFTELVFPMGPEGNGPEVCLLDVRDVKLVEEA